MVHDLSARCLPPKSFPLAKVQDCIHTKLLKHLFFPISLFSVEQGTYPSSPDFLKFGSKQVFVALHGSESLQALGNKGKLSCSWLLVLPGC